MAYQVTFTLNSAFTGTTEADSFTIVAIHQNGSPANDTLVTGLSKADLTSGVTYTVADTVTGGTVTSTGTCTNSVTWAGLAAPSPTATPGPTPGGSETTYHQFSYCDEGDQEQGVSTVDVSSDELEAAGFNEVLAAGTTVEFQGLTGCFEYRQVDATSSDERLITSVNVCTCANAA